MTIRQLILTTVDRVYKPTLTHAKLTQFDREHIRAWNTAVTNVIRCAGAGA